MKSIHKNGICAILIIVWLCASCGAAFGEERTIEITNFTTIQDSGQTIYHFLMKPVVGFPDSTIFID